MDRRDAVEETLAALDFAVSTGRAAYVGISNYTGWQTGPGRHLAARRARAGRRWPRPRSSTPCSTAPSSRRCCPAAPALGLGVLPWSPLGRGVLTGKYRTGTPSDSRGASPALRAASSSAYLDERGRGIVEAVARAADGLGWTPLEVALAWVRDRPGVTAPDRRRPHRRAAPGRARRRGQTLPDEIVAALDDVSGD